MPSATRALNLAFPPEKTWTLLCPYDAERLRPTRSWQAARHNHPHVTEHGESSPQRAFVPRDPGPRAAAAAGRRADGAALRPR